MAAYPALSFGTPSAGWLPVRLELDGKTLEFAASDVLADPIEQLCNSLLDVAAGRESKTEWFLEPDSYEFSFCPTEERVAFDVYLIERRTLNLKDLPEKRSCVVSWSGPSSSIVTSFWRGLKKFEHTQVPEKQWPWVFPAALLSKVEQRVRQYKNEG